jgi:hypothetical protein
MILKTIAILIALRSCGIIFSVFKTYKEKPKQTKTDFLACLILIFADFIIIYVSIFYVVVGFGK